MSVLCAVNYHYIRESFDAPYPAIFGSTPAEFQGSLREIGQAGTFVSMEDVEGAVRGSNALPDRAILITFDDGLREQYELAWPILRRMGIPAVFFINTAPVAGSTVSTVHKVHILRSRISPDRFEERIRELAGEHRIDLGAEVGSEQYGHYQYDPPQVARLKYLLNFVLDRAALDLIVGKMFEELVGKGGEAEASRGLYMDREQIRELAAHGAIGSHGHEHVPLGLLGPRALEAQLRASRNYLREWTGKSPAALSYPYGSPEACGGGASRLASGCGYVFAFTMERAVNDTLTAPLLLARFDNNDVPGGKKARWTTANFFDEAPRRNWEEGTLGT